jgi:hypothetical protein
MDNPYTKINIKRYRGGFVGCVDMPAYAHSPGRIQAMAVGDTRADALKNAALVAERIANDPVLSALMPPQAMAAIKAAKGLASAAQQGSHVLKHFWHSLHGPGKKRLAKALHDEAVEEERAEVGASPGRRDHRGKKSRLAPSRRQPPPPSEDDAPPTDTAAEMQADDDEQAVADLMAVQ